jgi:hypothetical protein
MTLPNGRHPHARWTSTELLDDISSHGIRAVKIWMDGDPFDGGQWCWSPEWWTGEEPFSCEFGQYGFENMADFWGHPGIDIYTIRFQNIAWASREYGANLDPSTPPKLKRVTFAGEPTYWIARELLARFGHLDKTIIITDWEQDWGIQGQDCRGTDINGRWLYPWDDASPWYSNECWEQYDFDTCGEMLIKERLAYVRETIERRQMAVNAARAEFPDVNLRILTGPIVNRYPANFEESDLGISLTEEISTLDPQPDIILLSFWHRRSTITEALDYIEAETGYPRNRIYVDELGEWKESNQYRRIYDEGRRAACWGVELLNVWLWRETWCSDLRSDGTQHQHGLFYHTNLDQCVGRTSVEFGDPRPGYYAVQDLIDFVPTEAACLEVAALPPTRQ